MKNVLVTGNMGYIGSVLCEMLSLRGYKVFGLDAGFYRDNFLEEPVSVYQVLKDIRDVTASDLYGIDFVVHLAALSNDPLGELDPSLTEEINFKAAVNLAKAAKKARVKRFIYSSSQSMYGVANTDHELKEGEAGPNGVTAYAKTKWSSEVELKKLNDKDFTVVCFRPSTVFGASPSLRCDIVFNNLVASAYTTGKIEIKSDGTPWRPVVHVRDVSSAFIAGIEAPLRLISGESFNVGIPNGNFTVRDLAEAASRAVPGSSIVFTGEHTDPRTYRVSFDKILNVLNDYYKPEWNLDRGGKELVEMFKRVDFSEEDFKGRKCNRLKQIRYLMQREVIYESLRWI